MSMSKITHVVLHYSATYSDDDVTAADIDKMHKARGWRGIGYHWFIRRDGTVEQGRPETQVGAHVGGQNSGKIGICCAGGLDRATGPNIGVDNRTEEQISAQIALIRDILRRHPKAEVVGHRDLAPTQCPGFDARQWWAKVNRKKVPTETPVPSFAPARTPDVEEDGHHVVEKGDTWWSISEEHGIPLAKLLVLNGATVEDVIKPGQRLRLRMPDKPEADKATEKGSPLVGIVALAIAVALGAIGASWDAVTAFLSDLF